MSNFDQFPSLPMLSQSTFSSPSISHPPANSIAESTQPGPPFTSALPTISSSPTLPLAGTTQLPGRAPLAYIRPLPAAHNWPSIGTPLTPSPQQMHLRLHRKKSQNRYFSITTTKEPWAPWRPLATNAQMETRPCYPAGSRTHKLTCGHLVVVARDAEPCATNCGPETVETPIVSGPVLATYMPTIEKIRSATRHAVNCAHAIMEGQDAHIAEQVTGIHLDILSKIWPAQDAALRPQPDLLSGDFSCTLCGTTGHRKSMPAFAVPEHPYFCVVVGRDEQDIAVISELEKGVRPERPENKKRWGGAKAGGRGGESLLERKSRVKDGRITKMRVQEKKMVTERLRDEGLLEGFESAFGGGLMD